jgi:hypothetical protein
MTATVAGPDLYKGSAYFDITQSTAPTAGKNLIVLLNLDASKIIVPTLLEITCLFTGVAAATLMEYEVAKGVSVTARSGGATIASLDKRTSQAADQVAIAEYAEGGVTLTNYALQGNLDSVEHGRVTQTATFFVCTRKVWDWTSIRKGEIELAGGECLVIRNRVNSVNGDRIKGHFEWVERSAA